jgi:DNA mismatch repair protein MutS
MEKSSQSKGNAEAVLFEGVKVKITPMMEQYLAAKAAHPGAVLLFRMGDFYEVFFDDAKLLHRLLGLTLTSRNKGEPDEVPMAGVPYRNVDDYLVELVEKGYRVAICDQLEDPSKAVGIVRRGVTRVLTPGTLVDPRPGHEKQSRWLGAVGAIAARGGFEEELGLAALDLSTGDFVVTELSSYRDLIAEALRIGVKELLLSELFAPQLSHHLERAPELVIQTLDVEDFDSKQVLRRMRDADNAPASGKDLASFFERCEELGFRRPRAAQAAIAAILAYCQRLQSGTPPYTSELRPYRSDSYMLLDETTRANLELTESIRAAKREGSLLGELDETVTAAGGRMLRRWLSYPLMNADAIRLRLGAVDELVKGYALRSSLVSLLERSHDLDRLCARIAQNRASPKDLLVLRETLGLLPELRQSLDACSSPLLLRTCEQIDPCAALCSLLQSAIADDAPLGLADGGVFRVGYDAALDELITLARDGKDWLLQYERRQRELTGISSLKLKFSKIFGYFIEVSRSNLHLVPEHFQRRQTLSNCERYATDELKEYEEKVLTAQDRRVELEHKLFEALRERLLPELGKLHEIGTQLATLDVLCCLAHVAHHRAYCCPEVFDDDRLVIEQGRHPVVERFLNEERFVPNDLDMNASDKRLIVITGPNMAGKSTVIRQAALIVLLAQAGSFVPAARAQIGLVDRIFSRVGASDNLARGQSTFMVEMTETANILHHASARSLVILDEIGRGTSTYDGLAIAWAVAETLHDRIRARVLFATHYHELTELARSLDGASNACVAVKEWQKEIIFLRKLVPGAANRSYGIQVARLAGVPRHVIERAEEILHNLEMESRDESGKPLFAKHLTADPNTEPDAQRGSAPSRKNTQLGLFGQGLAPKPELSAATERFLQELETLSLDTTTPLQALQQLYKWQRLLKRH